MKLISRNAHAFKWIYQETGLYINVLHEMLSFTDLLQSGEKPVPFRNRYYFPTLIFRIRIMRNKSNFPDPMLPLFHQGIVIQRLT